MKNKSLRHKDTNTFKFIPFCERITNIDVDIFHKVPHEYHEETEENVTFFHQTVIKWEVLNLSESYEKFQKELKPLNYVTLPQLLLVKDQIVQILLKHAQEGDSLSLQPLLELIVAVARDLQKEFHNYFLQTLEVLIKLLNTKDTEQLEWIFTCLAYLFKFLWRSLVTDINNVFIALVPLLSDNKPEYINNFAAESFAFIARKVKDKKSFLKILLKCVKNESDGISGCGKLLFHVINGINGQFHSCAETMLPFLFEFLTSEINSQNTLFEILDNMISNILTNILAQKSDLLWSTFINILNKLIEQENNSNNINLILKLIGHAIEYKEGIFLQNPTNLVEILIKILNKYEKIDDTILIVTQISILLLLSKNIKFTQEQSSKLIRKLLNIQHRNVFLHFIDNIKNYSSFEALILPNFIQFCIKNNFDTDIFHVLTKIIISKSPNCINGINLNKWLKYNLDFKESTSLIIKKLDNNENILNNFVNYYCCLICLPHLKIEEEVLINIYNKLINFIKNLNETDNKSIIKKLLFLINITIETLIHLQIPIGKLFDNNIFDTILNLTNKPDFINSLQTISLIISYIKKQESNNNYLTIDLLLKIDKIMNKNFTSPYHEIRLLTSFIYSSFEYISEFKNLKYTTDSDIKNIEIFNVFTIIYNVESIESTVTSYRNQIQQLEKLTYNKPQILLCNQTNFNTIPLRYLCGALYINFQLLWEPIIKIISTFANGMESNQFWNIFAEEINGATEIKEIQVENIESSFELLEKSFKDVQELKFKPDFMNYRILLWKALAEFPNVAEAKNRNLVELLLKFITTEYIIGTSDSVPYQSIKQNSTEDDTEKITDENNPNKDNNKTKNKKYLIRTLIQKLTVFSRFRSPLSVYREPELYKLYFDLLHHKNSDVQKVAMDCIFSYKHKYLIPYKEHLYNLIDDKNFRHELTGFNIDYNNDNIQSEHREGLIPILMQILFGKMNNKTGLRTGIKSSTKLKKNAVFRFLAGCQENELLIFLKKVLGIYEKFIKDDPEELIESVYGNCSLEQFLPPKKLMNTINLLGVIYEQCGGLLGNEILRYLLKVLIVIGTFLKYAYDNTPEVHSGYFSILRNLRSSTLKIIEKLFSQFYQYPWTTKEINAVFTVFIWPYLEKLNTEGIHSPTNLLKLFIQWGSNPKYFQLLIKHKNNDKTTFPLIHILNLLINNKTHISVINIIEEMLEKLLNLQPDEEDIKNPLQIDNILEINENINNNNKINYGSKILLPHVSIILDKLKLKLLTKSKNLNNKELFILSRISELVSDPIMSEKILDLLLPVVIKKCINNTPEDIVLKYINTIYNLIKNINKNDIYLDKISPLFGQITYPSCRKILCQILELITNKEEIISIIINELNSFDKKWIDQPDYEHRHDAFKQINIYINENQINLSFGIIIIYNCCYFINHDTDLSTKENSSYTIKNISKYLINKYIKQRNILLDNTIFNIIRTGLKNPKDNIRNEYISLLGQLSRECSDAHFILRDLNKYTNKIDLEVDFFENLIHLQIHRHARALLKFSQITKELTVAPNPRTLTQFILPLASHYICKEKYANKNSVIDGAIDAISVVCRILPWHQYEGVLKYYLMRLDYKLDYQKQLVRLIVGILDSFHFNLKNATENDDKVNEIEENTTIDANNKKNTHIDEEIEKTDDQSDDIDDFVDNDKIDEEEEEDAIDDNVKMKIFDKVTTLCKSTAKRVVKTLESVLLPKLHKSLAQLTHHENSHKVNRKKFDNDREEEDLLRVPISLAMVKLLEKLSQNTLEHNLPGIFMKLCTFLKSHLDSVRRTARETLQKIMLTLGPKYLPVLLSEMSPLLSRGFQGHVLVFTIHGVLNCLKDLYKPTDLDKILLTVLDLCMTDIFGNLSEEREVIKIAVKVSEARRTKSYDTLQILSQYITESCLLDLILPIKKIIENSHSYKNAQKSQEALKYIALGLVENTFIPTESLLKFAYGVSSKSIPQLIPKSNKRKDDKKNEKEGIIKEDCFIIPKVSGNRDIYRNQNVKQSTNTNIHLLVEFGLRLCFVMLKRDKIRDENYGIFIDPFVGVFKNCLKSQHVKLCVLTLQCLVWILKYDLPSLRLHIKSITKDIFGILHKYASAGLSKGDNFDLVVAAFKCMSVLVREVNYLTMDSNQLKILLLYVEQDMHNHERQATAFNLLKAILSRKINASELDDVMEKVAELSIISEMDHVRTQSRMIFHQYLMGYPLGNKLDKHFSFYLSQLSYELRFGRESAIEMISTFINTFPLDVLKTYSGTLLVTLGARLINDEEPECRKKIAECLSSMLKKLNKTERDPHFDIVLTWLKDKNKNHRRLAAQICGIFVTEEKSSFETRLPLLTPLLLKLFGIDNSPGKLVRLKKDDDMNNNEEQEKITDHHLFQSLQLLIKLCVHCPSFLKLKEIIENLAFRAQSLLAYPHDWVRLAAAQFLGYVLASLDINHLTKLILSDQSDENGGYLHNDPVNSIKSLTLDLCDQLQPKNTNSNLAEQVVKNLVFIAKLLQTVPPAENKPNLLWLTKRMRKIVNQEIVENSSSTILRTEVFKWIAGICTALELDNILPIIYHLIGPLVRELSSTEEKNAPLRQLAKEVSNLLKAKVGLDVYTETLSKQQQKLSIKKAERKRSRTQLGVTDPEAFAKRKIRRNEKKKIAKKRKIESLKGVKRVFKKRKTVDLDSSEIF